MSSGQGSAGFAGWSGNGLVALLVVVTGAFVLNEVSLQSTRPAANEPRTEQRYEPQDVDARLWQDPFGAVARQREQAARVMKPQQLAQEDERRRNILVSEIEWRLKPGKKQALQQITVLPVMLPGGPYAEAVEGRRRLRYAVLSGLNTGGFVPFNSEHLGYFSPDDNKAVPRHLPQTVPYEWFEPAPDGIPACDKCRVLVLWLDDDAFSLNPFGRMKRLMRGLGAEALRDRLRWQVVGPVSSGGLRAMVEEAASEGFDRAMFKGLDIEFLSPMATVADRLLLAPHNAPTGTTLAAFMQARGIRLLRTSGDDTRLARALVDELSLRGLRPASTPPDITGEALQAYRRKLCSLTAPTQPDAPQHIAVVAEWDTLYGRSLRRQFMMDGQGPGFCVQRFSYVRGLDGQLPERSGAQAEGGAPRSAADKEERRKDVSFIERAEGQSQFDYLRRLAARLHERDAALRAAGADGIRAIGVLGNDVHDKLLLLKALQPEFPNAVFFTTDLDARLLHPSEQAWARNLIVASNFGLQLADRLQAGTPPFRDTYQTAVFFTTRLALTRATTPARPLTEPAQLQARIDGWLQPPRLFEIGRTQAFDFQLAVDPAPPPPASPGADADCRTQLLTCDQIHPPHSEPHPPTRPAVLALLFSALLAAVWMPAVAVSRALRRRLRRGLLVAGRSAWHRRALLLAALLLLHVALPWAAARQWPAFADWLTANGKPMSLTEGISLWPTQAIHVFTLLLCLHLLFRGWTSLSRNLDDIALALHLGKTRRRLHAELAQEEAGLGPLQRLARLFDPHATYTVNGSRIDPAMTPGAEVFWKRYIAQNRMPARLLRTSVCTVLLVGLGLLLRWLLVQDPGVPVRGALSAQVHFWLALTAVVAMTFLVFGVVDATWFCVRFVQQLRLHGANWPQRTLNHFRAQMGPLPPRLLDHWIDLQFAARRTRVVTRLIYYPFIVLSLLLVARHRAFDDWELPWLLIGMGLLSLAIVLACAVALRRSVEQSRQAALREVDHALLRVAAPQAAEPVVTPQLQWLRREIDALREGAFAPFSQQPLLKAVLLPFATLGGTAVLDYLAMANL